jgi:hypothetical protein
MAAILPDFIRIEPEHTYIALARFLEEYNKHLQNEEINGLISEIGQPHLAQGIYIMWLEKLKEVLEESEKKESGALRN